MSNKANVNPTEKIYHIMQNVLIQRRTQGGRGHVEGSVRRIEYSWGVRVRGGRGGHKVAGALWSEGEKNRMWQGWCECKREQENIRWQGEAERKGAGAL